MKWFASVLFVLSHFLCATIALDGYSVPPGSPGYQHGNSTQAIQSDSHSLFLNGDRVFILSGEFHPWRLPVPELWADVLQKMKVRIHILCGLTTGILAQLFIAGRRL